MGHGRRRGCPRLYPKLFRGEAPSARRKALLTWHGVPFRKTHDLGVLGQAGTELHPPLGSIADRAARLTPYAWMYRYPGEADTPGAEDAEAALELAVSLHEAVLNARPPEART